MEVKIESSWQNILQPEFNQPYFKNLTDYVKSEYHTTTVYPPPKYIFEAFNRCPFDAVKVVIIGQDPYHGPHQAHGLCFSVQKPTLPPPSLVNIFKEIKSDIGKVLDTSGNLSHWTSQGVLLLNATLTVRANQAASHQNKGWERFTDSVIKTLSDQRKNLVFLLWGAYAQKKSVLIDSQKHLILKAAHPSPLSAFSGFFGCQHFSTTNIYLVLHGLTPICW